MDGKNGGHPSHVCLLQRQAFFFAQERDSFGKNIGIEGESMFKGKSIWKICEMAATIVFGCFLYAMAVTLFIVPADLVTGGATGIALAVNHVSGWSMSTVLLVLNVLMLVVGYFCLGRAFAVTTLASTFLLPAFIELTERMFADVTLTTDPFLCTVFGGIGIGVALGLVIRTGSSTGGMDIPPLVLAKYTRVPVSVGMYVLDVLILLFQAVYSPVENFLYGIVLVLVYSVMIDKVLLLGQSRIEVKIISDAAKQISDGILHDMERGVTLLHGTGAYTNESKQVVLSVISNRELSKLSKLARRIDPECFMIVSHVSEVHGNGFSLEKDDDKPSKK